MRLSYLPTDLRHIAEDLAHTCELTDDLSKARVLELLLNSEGIYGFSHVILGFVRAIDAAELVERNSAVSEV